MNTSKTQGMRRLFLDAMAAAGAEDASPRNEPTIDDERLLLAIRHERPLNDVEKRQLLLSVDLQERIAILKRAERIKAEDYWTEQGWLDYPIGLAAAADADRDIAPIHIEIPLSTIDLIPIDVDGKVWKINIRIATSIATNLLAHTPLGIQLVDSEGLVWVKGIPDSQGVLVGFWERDEHLLDRLAQTSLRLLPV